ncbi:MAG TPA: molybdate ABC transporter substrate-binding protein [Alphaproteobacteria bacterium]|jgi:molybdate transport system substrate-binding protein|nr:molybdate ABC transporter substrate-binding protein [Alphaproteobacteria bacterium]
MIRVSRPFLIAMLAVVGIFAAMPARAQSGDLLVFAAASLQNALDDVNAAWQREAGKKAVISYAASSTLAQQIEQGAPAQVFISADEDWMNYLAARNLIRGDTRRDLLGNSLVMVAERTSSCPPLSLGRETDLKLLLRGGKLAMADVNAVPAGKYGKAALESLGLWSGVSGQVAQAENVRAALLLVSRGEAPLGVVYATDAAADSNVRIVAQFPQSSYPPIRYPVALTTNARSPDAAAFVAFLSSVTAKPLLEKQGFRVFR